jgi:ubiquinone/menaquinone biosynthesis C-methylase UbiE
MVVAIVVERNVLCAILGAWVSAFEQPGEVDMKWNRSEIDRLAPILEQLSSDLVPVDGKHILVLGSASGDVVFRLAEMMEAGKVTGLELDSESLELARRAAHEMGLEGMVEFMPTNKDRLPMPDASFDALVSEFIVFPTSSPTEIGQTEMARVIKPGGKLVLTDVIVTQSLPLQVRQSRPDRLDYLAKLPSDLQHGWRMLVFIRCLI